MALTSIMRAVGAIGVLSLTGLMIVASQLDTLSNAWIVLSLTSAGAISAWMWTDRNEIDRALRSRHLQQSSAALGLTLVVAAAAIGINALAHRHDVRWDLTSAERHAIAPATEAILEGLSGPVTIRSFFPYESAEANAFSDLIANYQQHTDAITWSAHDPVREPTLANQFEVDSNMGTVILTTETSTQRMESSFDEEALTNALIRLTASVEHTICSTEGHGEIDPDDDMNPASISTLVTKLEQQNYTFQRLNLARTGAVPPDCSLLMIADPRSNFTPAELETLDAHVTNGGETLVLLDPGHAPNLAIHLANYGIDVGENMVLENHPKFQLMGGDASYLVVSVDQMTDHPITRPIQGMLLLRVARTVQALRPPMDGFDVGELFLTSEHAYAETRIDGTAMPAQDPEDPAGRMGLAVASVHENGGRMVVFGDSDFASNELLDQASNYDLLPNAVAWLADETRQVSIRPAVLSGGFTMSTMQGIVLWILSLLIVPSLALGGAMATWLQRRNR
jgi:ABC-type uncharacterized transport system involved in gliding motility auxiliary subunit